jgi:hypothetical protein
LNGGALHAFDLIFPDYLNFLVFVVCLTSLKIDQLLLLINPSLLCLFILFGLLASVQLFTNLSDEEFGREVLTKSDKNDQKCLLETPDVSQEVKDLR